MSEIHNARCCGCNRRIDVNGQVRRRGSLDFNNMRQVREAAKNHRWFCTNYTGDFHITATWYHDGTAEWYVEVSA